MASISSVNAEAASLQQYFPFAAGSQGWSVCDPMAVRTGFGRGWTVHDPTLAACLGLHVLLATLEGHAAT
jgi:hypothetical protein